MCEAAAVGGIEPYSFWLDAINIAVGLSASHSKLFQTTKSHHFSNPLENGDSLGTGPDLCSIN